MGIVANVKKRNRTEVELNALTIRLRTSRPERKEPHGEGTTDEDEDDEVKWKRAAIGRLLEEKELRTLQDSKQEAAKRKRRKDFPVAWPTFQPRFTQLVACYR